MTEATAVRIRVWVSDVWDQVELTVPATASLAEVKAQALAAATGRVVDPVTQEIKFRGALVLDESQSLESLGVPEDGPLIVLSARRRPVR